MAARMPKVHEGIVHCTDLDLWIGDGCAHQATGAVAAMMPMLVEILEGVAPCLDLDLRVGDGCADDPAPEQST